MWGREDSRAVGSEAATLERVRNSSLVERNCADNVTGLKPVTEAWDGRKTMVGERSAGGEGPLESGLERAGVRMPA